LLAALVLATAACGSSTGSSTPPATQTGPVAGQTDTQPSAAPGGGAPATPIASATPADIPAIYPVPVNLAPAAAAPLTPTLTPAVQAALGSLTGTIRRQGLFPGISIAVVFPDGQTWTGQSGMAILASKTPVAPNTLFSIGSMSKTFVAALALRLAERGTIGLDDTLAKYLPTFPNAAHISLRQLLTHRSGIRDLFEYMGSAIITDHSRVWTPEQVVAKVGKPYFAPGRNYHYSNTNYVLMGMVIEKATGQSLAALVRTEFLVPLGMKDTYLQTEEKLGGEPLAHAYCPSSGLSCAGAGSKTSPRDVSAGQKMLPYNSEASAASFSGAYVSTAADLARWSTALYGGAILDEAALATMLDVSDTLPFKPPLNYGIGCEQTTFGTHLAYGHRGHLDGMWGSMWYLPDSGLTIVVLTNDEWTNPTTVTARYVTLLLGK
jgi:D-alanyl-D-alanine carboxypeptidase